MGGIIYLVLCFCFKCKFWQEFYQGHKQGSDIMLRVVKGEAAHHKDKNVFIGRIFPGCVLEEFK